MSVLHEAGPTETLLGLDFGLRRIGVAVGSLLTGKAQPLGSVANSAESPDWGALQTYVREWQPARLVVGLPRSLGGQETDMSDLAKAFAEQLESRFALPVELVDEQLSSAAAREHLREARRAGRRRRRLKRADVDPVAAQVILETWLNEHRRAGSPAPDA